MFWYVATPYAKYPHGLQAAYQMACRVTTRLLRAGVPAFSPIAHGQGLSDHGGLAATEHDLWMRLNEPFMAASKGMVVITAEGWRESRGVTAEIEFFTEAEKPVFYLDEEETIVSRLFNEAYVPLRFSGV